VRRAGPLSVVSTAPSPLVVPGAASGERQTGAARALRDAADEIERLEGRLRAGTPFDPVKLAELIAARVSADLGRLLSLRLYDVMQVADMFGVSRGSVEGLIERGELRRVPIGARVKIPRESIEEFIKKGGDEHGLDREQTDETAAKAR